MKFLKSLALVLLLLLHTACSQPKDYEISADELIFQLQQSPKPLLLDVRTQAEYNSGYIQSAVNLPLHELKTKAETLSDHKDSSIVIYCRSGRRAEIARNYLISIGFKDIKTLYGHTILWNKKNRKFEKP